MADALKGPAARADVAPFHVMEVLSAAAQRQRTHGDVVSMCAGQPTAGAPRPVREAAQRLLAQGDIGYTEQLGIPALRGAIARHYRRFYDLEIEPNDVIVTTGSSGGFLLAFLAAFDAGARVAMARPGYPAYRNMLKALGCEIVEFGAAQATADHLDGLGGIDGLVIASPSNPTGTMLDADELAVVTEWCRRRGVQLISDEIYHGICFEKQAATAWETDREAVVLGSFSKYFGMTGWRLGWMLVPPRLRRAVDVLAGNLAICAPALAQHAAVHAFDDASYAELDGHVARYQHNRQLLLDGLSGIGITDIAPADGAFYAYADVGAYTDDSLAWCQRLLADTGVAITPGIDFDPIDGHRFVRFSFAGSADDVEECVRRMRPWLPRASRTDPSVHIASRTVRSARPGDGSGPPGKP